MKLKPKFLPASTRTFGQHDSCKRHRQCQLDASVSESVNGSIFGNSYAQNPWLHSLARLASIVDANSVVRRWFLQWSLLSILSVALVGCSESQDSLHGLDHVVPAHWPSSLQDAADKIEQRVTSIHSQTESEAARDELLDLIEWAPEIAADTDMSEEQWLPIYRMSETLRGHLNAGDLAVADIADDFSRLGELLMAAHVEFDQTENLAPDQVQSAVDAH